MGQRNKPAVGWIEVICGSMFSGKTEEMIRRIRRAAIAKQAVGVFKPKIDNRYSETHVVSHAETSLPSQAVEKPEEIYEAARNLRVVGIDEAQFFDRSLTAICNRLADEGKRVIVSGLDQDYLGQPFGAIPDLMVSAEYVTKLLAICVHCGGPANKNQRIVAQEGVILVGEKDMYEARCRRCYEG